ncbi:unnamed protein product [Urochloa humidicola]
MLFKRASVALQVGRMFVIHQRDSGNQNYNLQAQGGMEMSEKDVKMIYASSVEGWIQKKLRKHNTFGPSRYSSLGLRALGQGKRS